MRFHKLLEILQLELGIQFQGAGEIPTQTVDNE